MMRIANFLYRKVINVCLYVRHVVELMVVVIRINRIERGRDKVAILFGAPDYTNIGDLAIAWALENFVNDRTSGYVCVPLSFGVIHQHPKFTHKIIKPEYLIVGIGGGNMGDAYINEENFRRRMIDAFVANRIVIFPQTIYFSDTKKGKGEMKKTISIYSSHPRLTLIAREDRSYKLMREIFTKNSVLFSPDIVLSQEYSSNKNRSGLLLCVRDDKESTVSPEGRDAILGFANSTFPKNFLSTDTISDDKFFPLLPRKAVLFKKLRQFSSAELVITDRLHGMVFAAITGTPCLALPNYNHKVLGTYKWIKNLSYIKFLETVDDVDKVYSELHLKKYSYRPEGHEPYWSKIVKALEG